MADKADLDEAYRAADKARDRWVKLLPGERAGILRKVAAIIDPGRTKL